jgi:serine/threonine protein kinase
VVHRDIKPDNILLDEAGNAYLTDFGIAKDLTRQEPHHRSARCGHRHARLHFPEQILGEAVTPQTDIYSLGAVLYETLTGEKPFGGGIANVLAEPSARTLAPGRASRPDVPVAIDGAAKSHGQETGERYPTVLAMAEAFRHAVRGLEAGKRWPPAHCCRPVTEIYNPYKGLRAFQEADAAISLAATSWCSNWWTGWTGRLAAHGRFLAVVGPSGSGKSSVVKAGLIPALREGAARFRELVHGRDDARQPALCPVRNGPLAGGR